MSETAYPAKSAMTHSPPSDTQQTAQDNTSIAKLMGELVADAQELAHKEVKLAKQEVRAEINKAIQGLISLSAGIAVAAIGGLLLIIMFVHLLVDLFAIEFWLSYLIVGGVLAVIGGILLMVGRSRVTNIDPMPRETVDSVRKDAQWIKEQNPLNEK